MAATINAAAIAKQAKSIANAPAAARPGMVAALRTRVEALSNQLSEQYDWLGANESDPRCNEFFVRWHTDLLSYQAACDAIAAVPNTTQERLIA